MASPEMAVPHYDPHPQRTRYEGSGHNGLLAESVVERFFSEKIPGMTVRHATELEDRGTGEPGARKTDSVLSYNGETALAVQVTTNNDSTSQNRKAQDLRDMDFVTITDPITKRASVVPRVQVFVDTEKLVQIEQDADLEKHDEAFKQILFSAYNSLLFIIYHRNYKNDAYLPIALDRLNLIEKIAGDFLTQHKTKENQIWFNNMKINKHLIDNKLKQKPTRTVN